jgi:hypothetical protein
MFYSRPEEQLQEQIYLKKFAASLPTAIGALSSTLEPHQESDLPTYLYSGSTLIAIMDESDRWINVNSFKNSVASLPAMIGTLGSP